MNVQESGRLVVSIVVGGECPSSVSVMVAVGKCSVTVLWRVVNEEQPALRGVEILFARVLLEISLR